MSSDSRGKFGLFTDRPAGAAASVAELGGVFSHRESFSLAFLRAMLLVVWACSNVAIVLLQRDTGFIVDRFVAPSVVVRGKLACAGDAGLCVSNFVL